MKLTNLVSVRAVIFASVPMFIGFRAVAAESSPPMDEFSAVTHRVQGWVDHGYYPGAAMIVLQHGRPIYHHDFGRYTDDTVVFIASAGKWLAAATIMTLVDEGKLSLDDTAAKWIPELRGDPKGRATLRQMLAHTSGYPPYQPDDRPVDRYQTLAESVAHLAPLPPPFAPGERFDYGGLAMQAAGRMAELATGQDWETIFQERLAKPLRMTHTHFTPVDQGGGHSPMLGGGARSTARDYINFLTMISNDGMFEGRRVLSIRAVAEMQADQLRGAAIKRNEFIERIRGHTHAGIYGLGEWREELDARGNPTLLSSPSWAGTYPWIDKTSGVCGVFIAHVDEAAAVRAQFSGFYTSPVLAQMVRDAVMRQPKPEETLPHFEKGVVTVDRGDLYYEAAGAGAPVVFVHAHSVDRRMWDAQFAALAQNHRVIRYDLRGYGLSDLPAEGQEFTYADDLHRLLQALHIPRAHLVGLSLGAFVVGDMMVLHPEQVLSATVAGGGVHGISGNPPTPSERDRRLDEIDALRRRGIDAFKHDWMELMMRVSGPNREAIRAPLWQMIEDWSAWQPLHIEPASLLGEHLLDRLAARKVTTPLLIIKGANDSEGSLRSSDRLAAAVPTAKIVVIKDAGHWSAMDQPEAFTQALLDFLPRTSE